jgi:hypothetical protein
MKFLTLMVMLASLWQTGALEGRIEGTLGTKPFVGQEYTGSISSNVSAAMRKSTTSAQSQTMTISTVDKNGTELSLYIRDLRCLKTKQNIPIDAHGRVTLMINTPTSNNSQISYGMGGNPYTGMISQVVYEPKSNTISFEVNGRIGSFLSKGKSIELKNLKFTNIKLSGQKLGV